MTRDAVANCTRLRERFEGREAVYVDNGALRVRVTNIQANLAAQELTADLEEIPTPGFPRFIGLNSAGLRESRGLRWTIYAGNLTAFSDHMWSRGDDGWSMFFHPELVSEVMRFSETYSIGLHTNEYERYRSILGWVQCHWSASALLTRVFPAGEAEQRTQPIADPPAQIAEGLIFDDTGRTLRWGTPLHQLAEIDAPAVKLFSHGISLRWPDRPCLGGLRCDVDALRWFGAPDPRAYHAYLEEFHWVSLGMNVDCGATDIGRERAFREVYAQLERVLGPATFSYPRYEGRLPSIHWAFRGMDISYSMLSHTPSVYIDTEPEGYSALKADARAIARWHGEGARVNYVAWPDPESE
jgi:hypothetical protein